MYGYPQWIQTVNYKIWTYAIHQKKDKLRERQTDTNVKQNIVVDAVLNYMFVQHQEL